MKQRLITLDLSQKDALQSHQGIRGEDGYVVLTPFKPGLSTSANYKRNKRFLDLFYNIEAIKSLGIYFRLRDQQQEKCKQYVFY